MAIIPQNEFPGQSNPASPEYPYGSAQDVVIPGDGQGTPWVARLINDLWGFNQALLQAGGVVPNGNPDEVGSSQYLEALQNLINSGGGNVLETAYPVGALYISTLSTNPATLLGFGTWTAFAEGRTMVGLTLADPDFNTVEQLGGTKVTSIDGWGAEQDGGVLPEPTTEGRLITGSGQSEGTENLESLAQAEDEQSNLQPYIVTYMWKRTA